MKILTKFMTREQKTKKDKKHWKHGKENIWHNYRRLRSKKINKCAIVKAWSKWCQEYTRKRDNCTRNKNAYWIVVVKRHRGYHLTLVTKCIYRQLTQGISICIYTKI